MEMRVEENKITEKQLRKIYETNLQGYIFMAKENNEKLVINENEKVIICNAEDFWKTTNISVMDIEAENPKLKKCEYIKNSLLLEYNNRIIKIKNY